MGNSLAKIAKQLVCLFSTVLLNNVPDAATEETKGMYSGVEWVGGLRHTQDTEG